MTVQYWATVYEAGPALNQHRSNVSCFKEQEMRLLNLSKYVLWTDTEQRTTSEFGNMIYSLIQNSVSDHGFSCVWIQCMYLLNVTIFRILTIFSIFSLLNLTICRIFSIPSHPSLLNMYKIPRENMHVLT